MIAIIDNGGEYSDHAIYFIDIGDADPERVLPFLMSPGCALLGLAASVDWRDPAAFEPLSNRWNVGAHHVGYEDDIERGPYYVRPDGKPLYLQKFCLAKSCPVAALTVADREETERTKNSAAWEAAKNRPWDPTVCACTCEAGRLYAAAHAGEAGGA